MPDATPPRMPHRLEAKNEGTAKIAKLRQTQLAET